MEVNMNIALDTKSGSFRVHRRLWRLFKRKVYLFKRKTHLLWELHKELIWAAAAMLVGAVVVGGCIWVSF